MYKFISGRHVLTAFLAISGFFSQFCSLCCDEVRKHDVVYIVDLSASVEKESMAECFTAFEEIIRDLRRGTRISIIPVTSDATIDAPGRIKRFDVKEEREPYDDDLKRLGREMRAELQAMRESAMVDQYLRTDLLGAIALSAEEFAQGDAKAGRRLVVLSDFIQDDQAYRFINDARLGNAGDAKKLAREIAVSRRIDLRGVKVYLGLVRSSDLQSMPAERRAAVRAFWREYLRLSGASSIEEATDGPGLMAKFVEKGMAD